MTDLTLDDALTPSPPQAAAVAAHPVPRPFAFEGRAAEYFRIWIVNLCLTILTLGIYSAWATVRKKKYFYGNTWVDGSNFDYHGDPKAILRGRILAVGAFATYSVLAEFSPRSAAVLALAVLPAVPWLLLRSFRFNAVNSSYRHVRFDFHGEYRDMLRAVLPVFLFPVATLMMPEFGEDSGPLEMAGNFAPVVLFAALYPWMVARLRLIRIRGSSYGTAVFACDARVLSFYLIYLAAMAVFAVVGFAFALAAGTMLGALGTPVFIAGLAFAYLAGGALGLAFTQARVANLVFNQTRLEGGVRFVSTLSALQLAGIYFTNLLAVIATLGLLIPWAAVRTARYRASHLRLETTASLDAFVARTGAGVGATGDEVGEVFGFDLAL
jgi:uncharacterized membrane protein YjgN (DUF898 family)